MSKNEQGWTALHLASNYGRLEIVKELSIKNNYGQTALDVAIGKKSNNLLLIIKDFQRLRNQKKMNFKYTNIYLLKWIFIRVVKTEIFKDLNN